MTTTTATDTTAAGLAVALEGTAPALAAALDGAPPASAEVKAAHPARVKDAARKASAAKAKGATKPAATKSNPAAKAPARTFPGKDGTDIPTKARVYQPDGDVAGTVAYRVRDGRDGRPRIGVCIDVPEGAATPTIKGRTVKNVCVDANTLLIGERPKKRACSK